MPPAVRGDGGGVGRAQAGRNAETVSPGSARSCGAACPRLCVARGAGSGECRRASGGVRRRPVFLGQRRVSGGRRVRDVWVTGARLSGVGRVQAGVGRRPGFPGSAGYPVVHRVRDVWVTGPSSGGVGRVEAGRNAETVSSGRAGAGGAACPRLCVATWAGSGGRWRAATRRPSRPAGPGPVVQRVPGHAWRRGRGRAGAGGAPAETVFPGSARSCGVPRPPAVRGDGGRGRAGSGRRGRQAETVSPGSDRSRSTALSSPAWVAAEASGPWPVARAART